MFGLHLQWDLGKQPIYTGEGAGVRVLLARDRLGLTSAPAEAEWRREGAQSLHAGTGRRAPSSPTR